VLKNTQKKGENKVFLPFLLFALEIITNTGF